MPSRPCWLEINTHSLAENYLLLRSLAGTGTECLAIVKANAYGHGLDLCAPTVVNAGARWLGVTSVEEGVAARAVCPDARIVVMGGLFPGQAPAVFEQRLTPVVWEPWQLDELEDYARANGCPAGSMPIHLEIDTGMSRQGASLNASQVASQGASQVASQVASPEASQGASQEASPDDLPALLARFTAGSALALEAVMTHLYASDEAHSQKTTAQLQALEAALTRIRSLLPPGVSGPVWLSVGASAALLGGEADGIRALAGQIGRAHV